MNQRNASASGVRVRRGNGHSIAFALWLFRAKLGRSDDFATHYSLNSCRLRPARANGSRSPNAVIGLARTSVRFAAQLGRNRAQSAVELTRVTVPNGVLSDARSGETLQREEVQGLPLRSLLGAWVILNHPALRMRRHEIVLDSALPDWTDHGRPRRERP